MQFSGFAVSVRGASHEDSGTPCQDSARVLITDKLAVAAVYPAPPMIPTLIISIISIWFLWYNN